MPISGNSPSSREECACTHSTLRNDNTSFCTLHCPVTSCSAICLALGSGGRLGTLGTMCSSPSTASTRIGSCAPPAHPAPPCTPRIWNFWSYRFGPGREGTLSLVSSRLHVDVVHVVLFARDRATVTLRISQTLLDPRIDLLRNSRTSVKHVTFVTVQDCDSILRRVLTNRQQRFVHRYLNTTNSGNSFSNRHNQALQLLCGQTRSLSPGIVFPHATFWDQAVFPVPLSTKIWFHSDSRISSAASREHVKCINFNFWLLFPSSDFFEVKIVECPSRPPCVFLYLSHSCSSSREMSLLSQFQHSIES